MTIQYECRINNYDKNTVTVGVMSSMEDMTAFIHSKGFKDIYSVAWGTAPRTDLDSVTEYNFDLQGYLNNVAAECATLGTTE